jgi:large subunit ribosomal protein L14e
LVIEMVTAVEGLRQGQMVRSTAGRDSGAYYLITGLTGERFIQAADGVKHRIAGPKKKNLKHLRVTMAVAREIEEAFNAGKPVSDTQIQTAIHRLINQLEEGERAHG